MVQSTLQVKQSYDYNRPIIGCQPGIWDRMPLELKRRKMEKRQKFRLVTCHLGTHKELLLGF